jgi:IS30 family transposase
MIYAQPRGGVKAALQGFIRQMVLADLGPSWAAQATRMLPARLRRNLTPGQPRGRLQDRGVKMACRPTFARRLKIVIWLCDPHAPLLRRS